MSESLTGAELEWKPDHKRLRGCEDEAGDDVRGAKRKINSLTNKTRHGTRETSSLLTFIFPSSMFCKVMLQLFTEKNPHCDAANIAYALSSMLPLMHL